MNNAAVVEYCRISMAALSGGTAGLLGLTGLYGFGFYIFAVFGLWVRLISARDSANTIESCGSCNCCKRDLFVGDAADESWWPVEEVFHQQAASLNEWFLRRPFRILGSIKTRS